MEKCHPFMTSTSLALAQQFGLHQRRKVANAGARKQRGRKASVVVHREATAGTSVSPFSV